MIIKSLEYQLGYFVGEYIYLTQLPTLSIDSLQSRKVIYVTAEEGDKFRVIQKIWLNHYGEKINPDPNWFEMSKYHNELASKYLPHTLDCLIPTLDLKSIIDIDKFKEGIRNSLWNTDLCWYDISNNDCIQIESDDKWFTKVILKLRLWA